MARIYTVHHLPGKELRLVPDRFSLLGLVLPPLWAIWHGLWFSTLMMASALTAVVALSEAAVAVTWIGIGLVVALEGGSIARLELRLRQWKLVGMVEAETEAGAEELFLGGGQSA